MEMRVINGRLMVVDATGNVVGGPFATPDEARAFINEQSGGGTRAQPTATPTPQTQQQQQPQTSGGGAGAATATAERPSRARGEGTGQEEPAFTGVAPGAGFGEQGAPFAVRARTVIPPGTTVPAAIQGVKDELWAAETAFEYLLQGGLSEEQARNAFLIRDAVPPAPESLRVPEGVPTTAEEQQAVADAAGGTAEQQAVAPSYRSRTYSESVEQWRPLVEKYFQPEDVDKALYVINYESGGNPTIPGDGGHAIGLFQHNDQGLASGRSLEALKDPEANIALAAEAVYGGQGWGPWGEGRLFQGQPFGALGRHPYTPPGEDASEFAYEGGGEVVGPSGAGVEDPERLRAREQLVQDLNEQFQAGEITEQQADAAIAAFDAQQATQATDRQRQAVQSVRQRREQAGFNVFGDGRDGQLRIEDPRTGQVWVDTVDQFGNVTSSTPQRSGAVLARGLAESAQFGPEGVTTGLGTVSPQDAALASLSGLPEFVTDPANRELFGAQPTLPEANEFLGGTSIGGRNILEAPEILKRKFGQSTTGPEREEIAQRTEDLLREAHGAALEPGQAEFRGDVQAAARGVGEQAFRDLPEEVRQELRRQNTKRDPETGLPGLQDYLDAGPELEASLAADRARGLASAQTLGFQVAGPNAIVTPEGEFLSTGSLTPEQFFARQERNRFFGGHSAFAPGAAARRQRIDTTGGQPTSLGLTGFADGGRMRIDSPVLGIDMLTGEPEFMLAEGGKQENMVDRGNGIIDIIPTNRDIVLGRERVRGFQNGGTLDFRDPEEAGRQLAPTLGSPEQARLQDIEQARPIQPLNPTDPRLAQRNAQAMAQREALAASGFLGNATTTAADIRNRRVADAQQRVLDVQRQILNAEPDIDVLRERRRRAAFDALNARLGVQPATGIVSQQPVEGLPQTGFYQEPLSEEEYLEMFVLPRVQMRVQQAQLAGSR